MTQPGALAFEHRHVTLNTSSRSRSGSRSRSSRARPSWALGANCVAPERSGGTRDAVVLGQRLFILGAGRRLVRRSAGAGARPLPGRARSGFDTGGSVHGRILFFERIQRWRRAGPSRGWWRAAPLARRAQLAALLSDRRNAPSPAPPIAFIIMDKVLFFLQCKVFRSAVMRHGSAGTTRRKGRVACRNDRQPWHWDRHAGRLRRRQGVWLADKSAIRLTPWHPDRQISEFMSATDIII